MQVEKLAIPDVWVLTPTRHSDARGFFSETYSAKVASELGLTAVFLQDNHSLSREQGTVRGLHFQKPPFAQGKLVRVTRGRILDVAVDLRYGSPTFGEHVKVELSAERWNQLWIPAGFAHGLCTLEPNTEVLYKVTAPYSREHDAGVLWNDAQLAIAWPVTPANAIVSAKDAALPPFAQLERVFRV